MRSLGKLMMMLNSDKTQMVTAEDALPGRSEPGYKVPETHAVLGTPLKVGGDCVRADGYRSQENGKSDATQNSNDFHLVIFLKFDYLP